MRRAVRVGISLGHVQYDGRCFVVAVTSAAAPAAVLPASPVCKLSATQPLPSLQRLGAPDPHATGDAHHQ